MELARSLSKAASKQDHGYPPVHKFFPAQSPHDAYLTIREIVQRTQIEILVVDSWVDATFWTLMTNLRAGATVRVLTENIRGDFLLESTKFGKQQGCQVEVRKAHAFHDRFIIVDRLQCWHLGASIKDAGNKAFLISEILDKHLIISMLNDIDGAWQAAVPAQ